MVRRAPALILAFCLLVATASACSRVEEAPPDAPEAAAPAAEAGGTGLPGDAEAVSFLGDTLRAPELPLDVLADRQAAYAAAETALAAAPDDVDALIWMGRRAAYLGRYREAIDIYTHALTLHPDDARLYRHRGHRYLTVREPDLAIADLRRAVELTRGQPDEVEPDGLPNARGIPTSTLHFNIWYHLGLAHYVKGEFDEAAEAYATCAEVSAHPDSKVATAYWRYLTLARTGRTREAEAVLASVRPDMEIIESTDYLDLLMLYKGEAEGPEELLDPDEPPSLSGATTAYGVGMWYLLRGEASEARRIWRALVDERSQWASFGYLTAEAELARGR